MATTINLNADIAEGWGVYDIGNDAELMKIIKSASVACGFHAGDANTMHRLCMLAKDLGVSIGAHPGFKRGHQGSASLLAHGQALGGRQAVDL